MRYSFALCAASLFGANAAKSSLWVDQAPDHVRPYVIEHYANAQMSIIGSQTYRYYVTGASSGGAFTLLTSNSPSNTDLGVLPHIHERHHENFFCYKGRFQLWADKHNTTEARLLTAGDYGSVPFNTTHTYQLLDPDTELVGVIVPGGFEALFFHIADRNATFENESPYIPANVTNVAGAGSSASVLSALEVYDVYAQIDYVPTRDLVNGTFPGNTAWHDGPNDIPNTEGEPYYIAAGYGPSFLSGETGTWHVIQPFVTPVTGEETFTQGSITISRQLPNVTVPNWTLRNHTAFQLLEGALSLTIGKETVTLVGGDVAFVPGNTTFQYWSDVAFTKFMYISAGNEGLDQQLLPNATSWDFAAFPIYAA